MALFAISCIDKPNSLPLRMATREAHLAYANGGQSMVTVKIGGPYLDQDGNMAGSLLIVEAADRAAVEEILEEGSLCHSRSVSDRGHSSLPRHRRPPALRTLTAPLSAQSQERDRLASGWASAASG